jgi:hypothetical protein
MHPVQAQTGHQVRRKQAERLIIIINPSLTIAPENYTGCDNQD